MKKFIYLLLGTLVFTPPISAKTLIINEIMQSNIDCIMDDLNDFPDSWVEILNIGEEPVNLSEYSLGDSSKPKKAYNLPEMVLQPAEHLIIYCDKVGDGLHTSFRLESAKGGEVYLFHGQDIEDYLTDLKKQPAPNVAYGRIVDGSDDWGYMAVATPGQSNCGSLVKTLLPDPVFSHHGRVTTTPFVLSVSKPDDAPEDAQIFYTLDGSEPTEESDLWTDDLEIDGSTVVRAVLRCEGYITPRSLTQSYIFEDSTISSLPVVSLVMDNDHIFGDSLGLYPNYLNEWRRPLNVEFFMNADEDAVINQLGETKIKGGASRKLDLKSMVLYANKRFGEKRFSYEFFKETPGITEFKSIELRNAGNDYNQTYMRDVIIQQSFGMNTDIDWQPHQTMKVFINGEYKGILNLRPRSNEDHIYAYYDGLEDIDIIENWKTADAGSLDNFNEFKDFYSSQETHSFEEYEEWMDVYEFADYFLMNIFYDNRDFPTNNCVMWRPLEENGKWRWIGKDTDFGLGMSYSELSYKYPSLKWITNQYYDETYNWGNAEKGTILLKNILKTPEFRDLFVTKAAVYMGDFLRADRIIDLIDREAEEIEEEVNRMREIYNVKTSFSFYTSEMRKWVEGRVPFFYDDLADFFELGAPVNVVINPDSLSMESISVNDIRLSEPYFKGKWFTDSEISIETPDEDVLRWMATIIPLENNENEEEPSIEENIALNDEEEESVEETDTESPEEDPKEDNPSDDNSVILSEGKILTFKVPECKAVVITPVYSDPTGIENIFDTTTTISTFDPQKPFAAYSISGVSLGQFQNLDSFKASQNKGFYVLVQNNIRIKHKQ